MPGYGISLSPAASAGTPDPAAVCPGLGSRSADPHAAPAATAGRRAVVEGPLAVVRAAHLEPVPGAESLCLSGNQQQFSECRLTAPVAGDHVEAPVGGC